MFKKYDSSNRTVKINGCSFQQVLRQNLGWFLSLHWKTLFLRSFILNSTEGAQVLLKNGTSDFQNNLPFERSACFMLQSVKNLNVFNTLTLKQIFQKTKTFLKNWSNVFQQKVLRLKTHHFHTKLPYEKPVLRQIARMVSTKWTYHEERRLLFAINYFILLKILFQFQILL